MNPHDTTDWHTLLTRADAPTWVPRAVAEHFIQAHQKEHGATVKLGSLYVDSASRSIVTQAMPSPEALSPPDDLVACLGELLALTPTHPHSMRHVFQQTALLWRAYREGRDLPHGSDYEVEIVAKLILFLRERYTTPWMQKIIRSQKRTPLTTLHQLIDLLYEVLR